MRVSTIKMSVYCFCVFMWDQLDSPCAYFVMCHIRTVIADFLSVWTITQTLWFVWVTCTGSVQQFVAPSKCGNSKKLHRRIIHCPHSFCTVRKTQVMAVVRSGMFTSYFCFALWLLSSSTSVSFFLFTGPFSNPFSVMQNHWKASYAVCMCLHCCQIECVWMPRYECMEREWKLHASCDAWGVQCAGRRLVWLTLALISKARLPRQPQNRCYSSADRSHWASNSKFNQ